MSDSQNNSIIYKEEIVSDFEIDDNQVIHLSFESLKDNNNIIEDIP